jgi:hypothetical protein
MKKTLLIIVPLLAIAIDAPAQSDITGTWTFVKDKSTDLATWKSWGPEVEIAGSPDRVTIAHRWGERNQVVHTDSFAFLPGGAPTAIPVGSEIWTDNWFMGVLAKRGSSLIVTGIWLEPAKSFKTRTDQVVWTSQGESTLSTTREYRLDASGTTLTLTEQRASRPTPVVLVFQRSSTQ